MARRNDHTREELEKLAATAGWEIIAAEGFGKFSARGVAKKIGYTVGTVHNVFGGYDPLVLHINAITLDRLYDTIAAALPTGSSPGHSIKTLTAAYVDFATAHYNNWSTLFEFSVTPGTEIPGWYAEKIAKLFSIVERPLTPLFPDTPEQAQKAARVLWSGLHGICQLSLSGKLDAVGAASLQELTDSLIDNYLSGVQS